MSSNLKYSRNSDFPQSNTDVLPSGWFWKMTFREWAYASLDVVDTVAIDMSYSGATNNPGVIRNINTKRTAESQKVTLRFCARTAGNAFVYLHDPKQSNPFEAVEKILMQVEIKERRGTNGSASLTKLRGTTFVTNAPDTKAYEMGTTKTFSGTNPLDLFRDVPSNTDHVVIASHGMLHGSAVCMYPAGADKSAQRLSLDNVTEVFSTLKGKVSNTCVVWLGGCNIGSNNEFCKKAAMASGCPVVAAGYALENKKFPKDQVDILDKVSLPKVFLPAAAAVSSNPADAWKPADIGDFCVQQDTHKFVVPI